jgi:hypothetical protein
MGDSQLPAAPGEVPPEDLTIAPAEVNPQGRHGDEGPFAAQTQRTSHAGRHDVDGLNENLR